MAFQLHLLCVMAIFVSLYAEWVEITQKTTTTPTNKPKSSIRILKKSELEHLFNIESTTPSPQWIAYQKERFGQRKNSDSHKLVVTTENQMKNSAKVIVPANNSNKNGVTRPKNQIIKTTTRVDVINDKPVEELVELPHLETQTTTRRDMNHANTDDYAYVENVEDNDDDDKENAEDIEDSQENTNQSQVHLPSWHGFIKFVQRVQQYWVNHAGKTITEKINYLKRLRDNLMLKIEEQFDMIWPSKDRLRRNERSLLGESKINFPPEFALMSINFLTFAVFLIKLSLQIVHLLKSKHYKLAGLGLATQPLLKTT